MASATHSEDFISVVCPTCHTRLSARWDQAGKHIGCPDCGVKIAVPFAEPAAASAHAKPKKIGEYAVRDSAAAEARPDDVITVVCPTCHARLTARWDHAGKKTVCPDCGVKIRIPWPQARRADPQPDPKKIGEYGVRLAVKNVYVETRFLDQQAIIYAVKLPEPPRWTFFSGVFEFPWYRDNLPRWLYLSFGLLVLGEFIMGALSLLGVAGEGIGGLAVVAIGFMILPITWTSIWTYSYAASCVLAVVQDTAAGNDAIMWPDETWRDRVWKLLYVSFLLAVAALVGAGVGSLVELRGGQFWPPVALTVFLLFPIFLLSSLEQDSTWAILSPRVLKSILLVLWGWLVYYLFAGVLAAAWAVIIGCGIYFRHPFLAALAAAPLLSAVILVAARLLGRLAWKIADRLDEPSALPGLPASES